MRDCRQHQRDITQNIKKINGSQQNMTQRETCRDKKNI